jgi:hypothetical protein
MVSIIKIYTVFCVFNLKVLLKILFQINDETICKHQIFSKLHSALCPCVLSPSNYLMRRSVCNYFFKKATERKEKAVGKSVKPIFSICNIYEKGHEIGREALQVRSAGCTGVGNRCTDSIFRVL